MDSVKRKVISELFFAPSVVLPIVGGLSAGLLSWGAGGGNGFLTVAALAGVLGGIGWMVTRVIFKVEEITDRAMQAQLDQQTGEENRRLDQLAALLRTDRDHRTQDYLTLLRSMRSNLEDAVRESGRQFRSAQIREKFSQIFGAAIDQLRQSYRLWELAQKLDGPARDETLTERETVLSEIQATVERMRSTVNQFQEMMRTENKADLASMRSELDATMEIAKRTEQRMREIEHASDGHEAYVQE
ncbi:MAG: hypothetical protein KDB22_07040 [Planctomycetales bacterium]|nr:hypothetical protein [Planctomycetales bacterium]